MSKRQLFTRASQSPHNLHFKDFVALVEAFGFRLHRIEGDHHIFIYSVGSAQLRLNLQPHRGQAKAYQVRQFLALVKEYNLAMED